MPPLRGAYRLKNMEILLENPEFIVINKPPGLSVHPAPGVSTSVLDHFPGMSLAHRLDRETSGCLLLVKNHSQVAEFMNAVAAESSEKVYSAILRGPWKQKQNETSWRWSLSDKAEGRRNPQGLAKDQVPCRTDVRLIKSNRYFSWVECELYTGRQHQIRKHAAMSGQAIVGDSRYNDPTYNKKMADSYKTDRLFLHAKTLSFHYKGKEFRSVAPIPPEFYQLLPDETST